MSSNEFLAWLRQHLVPTLAPGNIVVMDQLSSHKVKGVREAIESVGTEVRSACVDCCQVASADGRDSIEFGPCPSSQIGTFRMF